MNKFIKLLSLKIFGREIVVSEKVTNRILLSYLFKMFFSLLRGISYQLIHFCLPKMLFIGRYSTFRNSRNIYFNKVLRVGDFSSIISHSKGGIKFGNNCSIASYCSIANGFNPFSKIGYIKIGDNVGIGEFSYIGSPSSVKIGSDTIIGQYLSIHPQNHIFSNINKPIRLQGKVSEGISIGKNCWIGSKVTFLDGASIGDGCIVAAGSVVKSRFENNTVIAGVPAKCIKSRI